MGVWWVPRNGIKTEYSSCVFASALTGRVREECLKLIPRLLESARSGPHERACEALSSRARGPSKLRGHQETEETPPQKHNRMSEARHRRRAGCRGLKSFARVAKRTCERQRAKQADLGGVESSSYLGPITRTPRRRSGSRRSLRARTRLLGTVNQLGGGGSGGGGARTTTPRGTGFRWHPRLP